jgi:hypothetical protein
LVTVKTEIKQRAKKPFAYLELDIEPHAVLDPAFLPSGGLVPCPSCGRLAMHDIDSGWDEDFVIQQSSIPKRFDPHSHTRARELHLGYRAFRGGRPGADAN